VGKLEEALKIGEVAVEIPLMPLVRAGSASCRALARFECASLLPDWDRNSDARGFQAHRLATVTRPLMVHRDVEGVDDFMGTTIVSRRHSAAETALKNF
jgi:hypothetical protein